MTRREDATVGLSNPAKIVILGASYAKGLTDIRVEKTRFINRGVAGERTIDMLARFRKDVADERPDAVIIWGFINDIFRSDRESMAAALERTRRTISATVEMARANGIAPIVATEVTIRGRKGVAESVISWIGPLLGMESYQDYVNKNVRAINQWIREYASAERIPLLDLETLLADRRGRRKKEFATDDGSHISAAGYARLSRYVEAQLCNRDFRR